MILYGMVLGKDFWELQKRILSRKYHVTFFESLELENILKKSVALHPKDRGNAKAIERNDGPTPQGQRDFKTNHEGPVNSDFAGSHPMMTW